jgi:hypothetical protein
MTLGRTIKRAGAIAAVTAATLAFGSVTASADGHGEGLPPHGHVMLLHADWEGSGPGTVIKSYAKCVDVAGGNIQPAHHDTIHMGRAGQALRTKAGHLVIPTFGGWTCADLAGLIPPG